MEDSGAAVSRLFASGTKGPKFKSRNERVLHLGRTLYHKQTSSMINITPRLMLANNSKSISLNLFLFNLFPMYIKSAGDN